MRDNEELMNNLRVELKRAVQQRYKRVELDRFKQELKEHVTHFLFEYTGRSPIVIPVVNIVGGGKNGTSNGNGDQQKQGSRNGKQQTGQQPKPDPTPEQIAAEQQRRFEEMRAKLLGQDARTD
jgi:ribonuclease J